MGLFENFGKNESRENTINPEPVAEEKEKQDATVEQSTENRKEIDALKKRQFEEYKHNIDEWLDNWHRVYVDLDKEEKDCRSKKTQIEDGLRGQEANVQSIKKRINDKSSDLDQVKKTGKGKGFNLDGFTVNGNLLPVLEADSINGYMTEGQKAYLSKQVEEVCEETRISSVERLRKILDELFHSDVVDTICNNGIISELIEQKKNKTKIMAAAITFVIAFLLFMFSGGIRSLFAAGMILIGTFAVMGLAGYGIFYLAREEFIWNLFISILAAIAAGIAGGVVFALFLADPFARILSSGNILVVIIVSLIIAAIAYLIATKYVESDRTANKLMQDQGLLKDSRKAIYASLENKEVQGLAVNTYIYCLLHYQDIINYLNGESLRRHIESENDEIEKSKKKIDALQRDQQETKKEIDELNRELGTIKRERERILSENDRIYEKINEWRESPSKDWDIEWIDEYKLAPDIAVLRNNDISILRHEGKTPILVEGKFMNMEDVYPLVKGIIDGFQRMNPLELLNIAVVDLSLDAENWGSYQDIPWAYSQKKNGDIVKFGSVELVSNKNELERYCKDLEKQASAQTRMFRENRDDKTMNEILEQSDSKMRSIREINKYMKKKHPDSPCKYHISIILAESVQGDVCDNLVGKLSTGVVRGFIPVIIKKEGSNLYKTWEKITEKANRY